LRRHGEGRRQKIFSVVRSTAGVDAAQSARRARAFAQRRNGVRATTYRRDVRISVRVSDSRPGLPTPVFNPAMTLSEVVFPPASCRYTVIESSPVFPTYSSSHVLETSCARQSRVGSVLGADYTAAAAGRPRLPARLAASTEPNRRQCHGTMRGSATLVPPERARPFAIAGNGGVRRALGYALGVLKVRERDAFGKSEKATLSLPGSDVTLFFGPVRNDRSGV
jgi:hypothetical protein